MFINNLELLFNKDINSFWGLFDEVLVTNKHDYK